MKFNFVSYVPNSTRGDGTVIRLNKCGIVIFSKKFKETNGLESANFVQVSYDKEKGVIGFQFTAYSNDLSLKINPSTQGANIMTVLRNIGLKPITKAFTYEKVQDGEDTYYVIKL